MFQRETIDVKDGSSIEFIFYEHASLGIVWKGLHIYIDPVGTRYGIDFSFESKADIILVTHQHADHFDVDAIKILSNENTHICGCKLCNSSLFQLKHLYPFEQEKLGELLIETIPAYNISKDSIQYHPRENAGLGYILNFGGTRVYIAGDTEDTEELIGLTDINIAFLPVCKPFTMSVEQVLHVVDSIHPEVLYPYHTACKYGESDLQPLVDGIQEKCELRIRNLK